jgi:hypothetical protein
VVFGVALVQPASNSNAVDEMTINLCVRLFN